jgi:uncharacterized membrane protein YfcA
VGFAVIIAIASVLAGAVAAVAGFGIGSILTPLMALRADTKTAVAAVSVPHLIGTALRFWRLRRHVDRGVFWSFGVTSAVGGLVGALLHNFADSPVLSVIFGVLLIFTGVTGPTGWSAKMRFDRKAAYVAGAVSGALGGLVGNQGGIRSAAMLGFQVPKESFVATATAIALMVDAARMPVYFANHRTDLAGLWVAVACAGVVAGTLGGGKILRRLPEPLFRRLVSLLILSLGLFVLARIRG